MPLEFICQSSVTFDPILFNSSQIYGIMNITTMTLLLLLLHINVDYQENVEKKVPICTKLV